MHAEDLRTADSLVLSQDAFAWLSSTTSGLITIQDSGFVTRVTTVACKAC